MVKTKEELEAKIALWEGKNKYIVAKAKAELRELVSVSKPKKAKKAEPTIYTKDELMGLNKDSQVELLSTYGVEGNAVPKLEGKRVKLILKLQSK